MRQTLAAACVLVALAGASSAPAVPECVIRAGPHFRVVCHFDDDASATTALETAEAIWPVASGLYGLADAALDPPLDVHLYRRAADYLVAEREIVGGAFDKNLAFSSFETRSGYVAVQPDLTDETLAATGITAQTRHNIAHEATHLVAYRASPGFRSHPSWFAEGAAIWVEEEAMASHGWSAGGAEDPYVAAKMVRAKRLHAGGGLPSAEKVLRDETADMQSQDRYAVQALLFRRLVTRRDSGAFRAALLKAIAIEPGADYVQRFRETMTAPYATEGLPGLDLDFEQHVRSQAPAWDETYRTLSTAGDAWVQTAFPENNAVAWRTASVGAAAYEVRGQVEILPGSGKVHQMNVLLSRDDDGFVSVAMQARGGVYVLRYHKKEDRWEQLAAGPTKAVQLWRRLPFRVAVDGSKVTVRLDGAEVVSADVGDHAMSGPWGLGAQAGGAGVWRGVRVEPSKPR